MTETGIEWLKGCCEHLDISFDVNDVDANPGRCGAYTSYNYACIRPLSHISQGNYGCTSW